MGLSRQEITIWEKVGHRYDSQSNCLNCGAFFYAPHHPECIWADDAERLNERLAVTCGDCLSPNCRGCIR